MHLAVANRTHAQMHLLAEGRRRQAERVIEHGLQRGLGLGDGQAGLYPREGVHDAAGVCLALLSFIQGLGKDNVRILERGHFKILGQHADDAHRFAIDIDQAVENAGIAAIMRLPQCVGNERDFGAVGSVLFRKEITAQQRRHAERREKVLLHARATQTGRIALGQIAGIRSGFRSECIEGLLIVAPLIIGAAQHEFLRDDGRDQAHRNQPLVMRVG